MKNSVIKITEQEYLIKLDKSEFDLPFIHSLLKSIKSDTPFFRNVWDDEDDIIARRRYSDDSNFDDLSEK